MASFTRSRIGRPRQHSVDRLLASAQATLRSWDPREDPAWVPDVKPDLGRLDGPRGGAYYLVDLPGGRVIGLSRKDGDDRVWLGKEDQPETFADQRGGIGKLDKVIEALEALRTAKRGKGLFPGRGPRRKGQTRHHQPRRRVF
jgi:hypothetical protein